MSEASRDLVEEYTEYLRRFEATAGEVAFGTYVKLKGRLVKKLTYEEFEPKWREYKGLERTYHEILERGDTINDIVVRVLRERCDELMVDRTI